MVVKEKKTCTKCSVEKPMSGFSRRPTRYARDGRASWCNACMALYSKRWQRSNPEKTRTYRLRWELKNRERITARVIPYHRRYTRDNPEKIKAQNLVARMLRRREMIRGVCEICGTTERVHGHHDDYSKPLEVRWLCARHHRLLHAEQRCCGG